MKKLHSTKLIFLFAILLNACNTQTPLTPTTLPTEKPTQLPTPEPTKTPTQEPTETAVALSPKEQEFFELGYDKLSSLETGVIYGILDESSVKYLKSGGVEVKDGDQTGYALSTVEVTYYNPETKKFEKGRFVMDWSIATGTGSYATYPVDGGSAGGSPDVIPQQVVKSHREQYFSFTPGKTPFVKIMFDYDVPGVDPVNKFLDKAFPEFKGKIQVVDIPGVGKVLAIKGVLPEGYPGW